MPVWMPVRYAPQAPFTFPKDGWTRLVAAFGPSGAWNIYADGEFAGEREAMPTPVR